MPPCCHIIPGPHANFLTSLQNDAEYFSRYVGRGGFIGALQSARRLTSGLHFEMKLWNPPPLAKRYRDNDSENNSWVAMSQRTTAPQGQFPRFDIPHKNSVFNGLCGGFPNKRSGCALLEYDRWILKQITMQRTSGLKHAGISGDWHPIDPNNKPPELGTVGLAQKLINIFVKYQFCWQRVGQWQNIPHPGGFIPCIPMINPNDFMCALHAPIDRIILRTLNCYALGKYLKWHGMLNGENIIQTSDHESRPWSKLDCLRTYYGFQLVIRRVAMRTWPVGCSCSDAQNLTNQCVEMFEREFSDEKQCQGPDWIQAACELPNEVIDETLKQLEENEHVEEILKKSGLNEENQRSIRNILDIK